MQSKPEINLEAKDWTKYHTFLTIFLSITNFYSLFSIVFSGLILNDLAISFAITQDDLFIVFTITGFSGLFTILPRYLTDRYGRKPLLLLANIFSLGSTIASSLAPNIIVYICFSFIGGAFGINISSIVISEEVPARYRGKAMGLYTGIGMSSSILASYLFTFCGQSVDMWRYIYSIVSFSGLLIITCLWFKLKETNRFVYCKASNNTNQSIFRIFDKKHRKLFVLSGVALFLTGWIYITIKRYFVIFLKVERSSLGFTDQLIGTWLIFIYMGSIIGYYISGILADHLGRKKSIYINIAIYFIGSLIFLFFWNIALIFIGLFILNLTFAIYRLIAELLTVEFWPTELRTIGSGWAFVMDSSSGIIGNLVMFLLIQSLGSWGTMFLVVGTICLIALAIVIHFIPETKQRVVEEIYSTEIEKNLRN